MQNIKIISTASMLYYIKILIWFTCLGCHSKQRGIERYTATVDEIQCIHRGPEEIQVMQDDQIKIGSKYIFIDGNRWSLNEDPNVYKHINDNIKPKRVDNKKIYELNQPESFIKFAVLKAPPHKKDLQQTKMDFYKNDTVPPIIVLFKKQEKGLYFKPISTNSLEKLLKKHSWMKTFLLDNKFFTTYDISNSPVANSYLSKPKDKPKDENDDSKDSQSTDESKENDLSTEDSEKKKMDKQKEDFKKASLILEAFAGSSKWITIQKIGDGIDKWSVVPTEKSILVAVKSGKINSIYLLTPNNDLSQTNLACELGYC